jgi:hypothetical protein
VKTAFFGLSELNKNMIDIAREVVPSSDFSSYYVGQKISPNVPRFSPVFFVLSST